jgi:hypothetical protein
MQECIELCKTCHDTCLEVVDHCLRRGGDLANPEHLKLLADCADICRLAGDFMTRNSRLHARTIELCIEICEECAIECDRYKDDPVVKHCADVCRKCVHCCRQLA